MDDLAKEAVKQVPSLAVLCFIVWAFLKSMSRRDSAIERLHAEHIAARADCREALRDNTLALREFSTSVAKLAK